jgi:hypothetical protein
MKITGYQLREALKQQELRRDTAARAFNGSLKKFPDETKEEPGEVVTEFLDAENKIAQLQVAQMAYNLAVEVVVQNSTMSLAAAIKRIGGPARAEKMWRTAAGPKPERYSYRDDDTRNADVIVAKPTVTSAEALKLAQSSAKLAGAYRAAIATGNAKEVEIQDLSSSLFE